MGKRKSSSSTGDTAQVPNNPFGALAALQGQLPASEEPVDEESPKMRAFATKVVVSRERSGRGGKTVTLVRGVLLQDEDLLVFLATLRKALGTSGHVENDSLVLGGDIVERVATYLEKAGAPRVIRGN